MFGSLADWVKRILGTLVDDIGEVDLDKAYEDYQKGLDEYYDALSRLDVEEANRIANEKISPNVEKWLVGGWIELSKRTIKSFIDARKLVMHGIEEFLKDKIIDRLIEGATDEIKKGLEDLKRKLEEIVKKFQPKDGEFNLTVAVVTSIDPNEKVGSQGAGEPRYLSGEEPLRYAVFFENLETATAPAQEVIITDQLDTLHMDLSTLSLGQIAFGSKSVTPPPGLSVFTIIVDLQPDKDLLVRINVNLDPNNGLLTWRFTSLDPATGTLPEDPLAGFLPPNVNSPEGEGSVLFTVMPKRGLSTGIEIRNQASIVFDMNPPVDTQEWFNTLDNTKPTSAVQGLAATQLSTSFEVRWPGIDMDSGILDYTIFVSENGDPFTPFLTNTLATSATFTGQPGKTYAFYSMARDQTGNQEEAPTGPDATTTILANQPPTAQCQNVTVPTAPGVCTASASVDAGSSDPDGDPITLSQSPTGPYSLGTTSVTLTVTDDEGASDACMATVTIVDQQPPTIGAVTANPNVLWPPNHKMVPVTVRVPASDSCDAAPVCRIVSVSSNEPVNGTGGGDKAPDWQITGALTVNLRAERSGAGSGRVYTITVGCTDTSSNSATKMMTVSVPHDQGR